MAPTNKDIVVRVLGQTKDVEQKILGTQTLLQALEKSFSSLGGSGTPMVAAVQQLMQKLSQTTTVAQDFKKVLGSVDSNKQSVESVAKAYGNIVKAITDVEKEAGKLNTVLSANTGNPMPILIRDAITLRKELAALSKVSKIGFDIETTSKNFDDIKKIGSDGKAVGRARVISLAAEGKTPIVIDLDEMSAADKKEISKLLTSQIVKVAHNIEFEKKWLEASGIKVGGPAYDTLHAARNIWPAIRDQRGGDAHGMGLPNEQQLRDMAEDPKSIYTLANLVRTIFQRTMNKAMQDDSNWRGALTAEHLRYNAQDSVEAINLHNLLEPKAAELGLTKRINDLIQQSFASAMRDVDNLKLNKQDIVLDNNAIGMLQNIQTKFKKELNTIEKYLSVIDDSNQQGNLISKLANRDIWDSNALRSKGQESKRMEQFKDMALGGVENTLKALSDLNRATKANDIPGSIQAIGSLQDSLRNLATVMPIADANKNPFARIQKDLEHIRDAHYESPVEGFTTTLQHLGDVIPGVRKALEGMIKDLFSPDQLTALVNAGKLPGGLSPRFNKDTKSLSTDDEEALRQQLAYNKPKIQPMSSNSNWFAGYVSSVIPHLGALSRDFSASFDDEEHGDMLQEAIQKAGIPKIATEAIRDIIMHQANHLKDIMTKGKKGQLTNEQVNTEAAGTVENTVNQLAKRMRELDEYISDDTIKTLNYNLKRLEQYKSALQTRIKKAGIEGNATGYGPALTSVENNIRAMREAIAATVMSKALLPFADGDVEMQKDIARTLGTMVTPQLDNIRDIIGKQIKTPQKFVQKLADGTRVAITDIEQMASARGAMQDLEALRAHDGKDYDSLARLRAALLERQRKFRELGVKVEDSDLKKAYKAIADSIERDLAGITPVFEQLRAQKEVNDRLTKGTQAVRDSDPITLEFAKAKDTVEKELRLLAGMSKLGGIDLTQYKKFLLDGVKDLRDVRQRYNTFKSLLTGKAPVYEAPMGDKAWEEAGLNAPLQWDKNGMARNALKALQEYKTRLMQVFHKVLFENGTFRPDQIREMIPIAKTAGLDELYQTAKSMWTQMDGKDATTQQDLAREFTPQLRQVVSEAKKLLDKRTDLLKVISGSMSSDAYQDKRQAELLSAAGKELMALVAGAGSFGAAMTDPIVQQLVREVQDMLGSSQDMAKYMTEASTATGRHKMDQKALKEELYKIEEALHNVIDADEKGVLQQRKEQILDLMNERGMSLKGMTPDEQALNVMRAEMQKLNASRQLASVAADGVQRIIKGEIKAVEDFTKPQLIAMQSLLGESGSVSNLLTQTPEQLGMLLTDFKSRADRALSEISRLDSLTRKNTLTPKGMLEQNLDEQIKEAQRSWASFAKDVPNDVKAIDAAYKQWALDNTELINSIQGLKYKLQSLKDGVKPESPKDELARVNEQIKNARNLQMQALRGTGEYSGLSHVQKMLEVRKISDEQIKPLERLKKELQEVNKLDSDSSRSGGGGAGRGLIGWLNRIAITIGSLSFLAMQARAAIEGLIMPGLRYEADVERSTIGLASIIKSLSVIDGKTIEWNKALRVSATVVKEIKDTAMMTGQQSADLLKLTQGLMGSGLTAGMSLQEVIKFSSVGSSALQQIGMDSSQFIQELRDMVQGGIQPQSSVLASILGITDADVSRLRATGQLFDELMKRMDGFQMGINEYMNTIDGKMNVLRESLTRVAAEGLQSTFNAIKWGLDQILDQVLDLEKSKAEGKPFFRDDVIKSVREFSDSLLDFGNSVIRTYQSLTQMGAVTSFFSTIKGILIFIKNHMEGITKIIMLWLEWKITSTVFSKIFALVGDLALLIKTLPGLIKGVETAAKLSFATGMVSSIVTVIENITKLKTALKELAALEIFVLLVSGPVAAGKSAKADGAGWFAALMVGISTFLGNIMGAIYNFFKSGFGRIATMVTGIVATIAGLPAATVIALVVAIGTLATAIIMNLEKITAWVKDKLKWLGINIGDEKKAEVDLKQVAQTEKPQPEDYWSRVRNKYAALKADDIKSLRAAEREYWAARTKVSIDTLKTELDIAKNQLQRLFDEHQVTIKQYYDQLYTLRNKEMNAEATLLQSQVDLLQQQLGDIERISSGVVSLKGKQVGGGAFEGFEENITSQFGYRESPGGIGSTDHKGIDIGMDEGTPLSALTSSKVTGLAMNTDGRGYAVYMTDSQGNTAVYMHMNGINPDIVEAVNAGKEVTLNAGDYVGVSGNTGASTGAHLHFGVKDSGGEWFDPTNYLKSALTNNGSAAEWTKSRLNEQDRNVLERAQQLNGSQSIQPGNLVAMTNLRKEIMEKRAQLEQLRLRQGDLSNERAAAENKAMADHFTEMLTTFANDSKLSKILDIGNSMPSVSAAMKNMDILKYLDQAVGAGDYKGQAKKMSDIIADIMNTAFEGVDPMMQDQYKLFVVEAIKSYAGKWREAAEDEGQRKLLGDVIKRGFGVNVMTATLDEISKTVQNKVKNIKNMLAKDAMEFNIAMFDFEQNADQKYTRTYGNLKLAQNYHPKQNVPLVQDALDEGQLRILDKYKTQVTEIDRQVGDIIKGKLKIDKSLEEILSSKQFKELDEKIQKELVDLATARANAAIMSAEAYDKLLQAVQQTDYFKTASPSEQRAIITKLSDGIGDGVYQNLMSALNQLRTIASEAPLLQEQINIIIDQILAKAKTIPATKKDNQNVKIFGVEFDKEAISGALTSAFSGFLMSIPAIINGTKSIGSAFRDMAFQVVQAMLQIMVQQFAKHLVTVLLAANGGEVPAKANGGQVDAFASGGSTINGKSIGHYAWGGVQTAGGKMGGSGSDTSDNQLIAVSPNEWIIRANSARKYGPKFMKAVNEGTLDANVANGLVPRYASGGIIKSLADRLGDGLVPEGQKSVNAANLVDKVKPSDGGSVSGTNDRGLTIVNVTDPKQVRDYLHSSDGTKTFINMVNNNKNTLRRIINS